MLIAWENEALPGAEGARRRTSSRSSCPSREHPGRAAGGASSTRSSTSTGTRKVARGLPRVPLHARRPGDRRQELLPPASTPQVAAQVRRHVPEARSCSPSTSVFGGWAEGAEDALRRRRRVRPDLQAGPVTRPRCRACADRRPSVGRGRCCWAASGLAARCGARRRGRAAQRLLRPDARALQATSTRPSPPHWKAKTGEAVTDQAVARRLGQAGARGDRRPRGRRGDAGARPRHRRDRRGHGQDPGRLAEAPAEQQRALHLDDRVPRPQGQPEGRSRTGTTSSKPGVQVITPNPKTSGGARWNYLAAWGYALDSRGGDEARRRDFVAELYRNVPVLDTGARGSTTTFAQRGIGDVLIAWENEAFLALDELGEDKFEIVYPVVSHPGRAAGRARRRATSTPRARARRPRPISSSSTRPRARRSPPRTTTARATRSADPRRRRAASRSSTLFTIDDASAAGRRRRPKHFADGGVFDQIYRPGTDMATCRAFRAGCAPAHVLPGFGLALGFTLTLALPDRPDPARRRCSCKAAASARPSSVARRRPTPRALAALPAQLRRVAARGARSTWSSACSSPGCWSATVPGQRVVDAHGRPAVRAADRGRRHRADRALRAERLARRSCSSRSASRSPTRRSASSVALIFVGLPFVVRTVQPVLEELEREIEEAAATLGADRAADLPPGDPAGDRAGAADRLRARLRARRRRVRLGDLHRRQHAATSPRSRRC